jgi:hypothetical protein
MSYLPWIGAAAVVYGFTAQLAKRWYLRRHDDWL